MYHVTAGWETLSVIGWYTFFWYIYIHTHTHTPQLSSKRTLLNGGLKLQLFKKFYNLIARYHIHVLRYILIKNHVFWSSFDHVSNVANLTIFQQYNKCNHLTWSNELQNMWISIIIHLRTLISYCVVGSWFFFGELEF